METFNVERIFEHASVCSGSFGDRCNRVRQQRTELSHDRKSTQMINSRTKLLN